MITIISIALQAWLLWWIRIFEIDHPNQLKAQVFLLISTVDIYIRLSESTQVSYLRYII